MNLLHGILGFSLLKCCILSIILIHITFACTSLYLHRSQAHNAITFHPIISHFCRFWMWVTTTTTTKQWVAVHRKHHSSCETIEDPHSPNVYGISRVLFKGYWLYRAAAKNTSIVAQFGIGTPNDWMEQKIYTQHPNIGLMLLLAIELVLFGACGLVLFIAPIVGIGWLGLGVVNGIGHYWGYRNFKTPDNSRNFSPLGIFICGEELHNNHHGSPTAPFFSEKWFECDMGGIYLRLLSWIGLAKIKTPPKLERNLKITHKIKSNRPIVFEKLTND